MFVVPSCKVTMAQAVKVQKLLGLTNEEFAQDLGVSLNTVERWHYRAKNLHDGFINRLDLNTALMSHMINLNIKEVNTHPLFPLVPQAPSGQPAYQ